jgi:hypothetical protein
MSIIKNIIRIPVVLFIVAMAFILWVAIGFCGWLAE